MAACIILIAGWLLGYFYQYYATEGKLRELRLQVQVLNADLDEMKKVMPVVKKVSVKTTAYSNDPYSINVPRWRDGLTATNTTARRGIVAADWGVFPPGTRLYIPGYGEAVVEDRGGAVRGHHLDLFVDSRREALEWGVREVEVFVLRGPSTQS
jgi:3D (Asp-Asp-Asp) domain-containing protein